SQFVLKPRSGVHPKVRPTLHCLLFILFLFKTAKTGSACRGHPHSLLCPLWSY
ncbi:hypothetical protein XENOCAPTIV_017341, partial [Xenoophorus captivus]